jgi:hypothetical protein
MDDDHLYDILKANSPLSENVLLYVDTIAGLPSEYMDTLTALYDTAGMSLRQEAELEIRYHYQQLELGYNELFRLFLLDTNSAAPQDSILHYLEDYNSPLMYETMIRLYWEKGQFTEAQDLIDSISEISGKEHLVTVLNKIHTPLSTGDSLGLFSLISDTALLDSIALDSTMAGFSLARNIMMLLTGKDYNYIGGTPQYQYQSLQLDNIHVSTADEIKHMGSISVFPNPSQGTFQLVWNNKELSIQEIRVYDLQGQEVWYSTMENQGHATLQLNDQPNGIYILTVNNGKDEIIHREKISIAR